MSIQKNTDAGVMRMKLQFSNQYRIRMMKKYISAIKLIGVITMLSFCLAFLACQPTPQKDIVVNKGDSDKNPTIDAMLKSTSAPFVPYDAPKHIKREGEEKNSVTVSFDADIDIPTVRGGYAVTLIEKRQLSDETILRWARYLAGDAQLVKVKEKAKADYVSEMEAIQATIAELEKGRDDLIAAGRGDDAVQWKELLANYRASLSELQAQFNKAPDTAVSVPLNLKDFAENEWVKFGVAGGRDSFNTMRKGNRFSYWKDYMAYGYIWESLHIWEDDFRRYDAMQEEFAFTKEQAQAVADKALREMGGFEEYTLPHIEKCLRVKYNKVISGMWLVTYSRDNHGLPSWRQMTGERNFLFLNPPVIGAPWELEHVYFYIDNSGILGFSADGLGTESMVLLENVELLPIDEVLQRITALLQQIYSSVNISHFHKVCVERLELRSALISLPNEKNRGISIPVWHFSGTIRGFEKSDETQVFELSFEFTVDARDGGYIEPIEPSVLTTVLASYR